MTPDFALMLQITAVGGVAMVAVLVFFGNLAGSWLGLSLEESCRWAGFVLTMVLIATFTSCYVLAAHVDKDPATASITFVLYWFMVSLFLDLVWEMPLWTTNAISSMPVVDANLPVGIIWWAYTLSDTHYRNVTPVMVIYEIWWLLGNFFGAAGLVTYSRRSCRLDLTKSLLCFVLCGALQCYNASLYLFLSYHVHHLETINKSHWHYGFIFWGLNGFYSLASAMAAVLSYSLLLGSLESAKKTNA